MPLATFDPHQRFHWIGSHELLPGSVVKAGNWGTLVLRAGLRHTFAGRELLWDDVRKETGAQPSRLKCAFVLPLEPDRSIAYRNETSSLGRIFEVELVDPDADSRSADMCWINLVNNPIRDQLFPPSPMAPSLHTEREWAEKYWNGAVFAETTPTGIPPFHEARTEFLTMSDLRIVAVTVL